MSKHTITESEARVWLNNLTSDMELGYTPILRFSPSKGVCGIATPNDITLARPGMNLEILAHEIAHHIEWSRKNTPVKPCSDFHSTGFFRICFELADWISSAYGINLDTDTLLGYDTAASRKAKTERLVAA